MAKQRKTEEQPDLDGIPPAAEPATSVWRVNFQYQGAKNALRAGALIINSATIEGARTEAAYQLAAQHGKKWFSITSIVNLTEIPF